MPKFRWKLKEVPLHLDRAVWIEDKDFDIDKHLRRIAVPSPGGRREVGDLFGMLMGYQLDRRRPLWEMWYVDGVVGGQVALITKFHHCLMDGVSGAGLAEQLFDLEPNPPSARAPSGGRSRGLYVPSDLELVARALIPTLQTPRKVFAVRWCAPPSVGVTILQQRNQNPMALGVAGPCFNGIVGPRRQSSFTSVSLDDVRAVKDALGVKVNDVVLGLVSGALRRHMERHGDTPESGSLAAQVPVSTRLADDKTRRTRSPPWRRRSPPTSTTRSSGCGRSTRAPSRPRSSPRPSAPARSSRSARSPRRCSSTSPRGRRGRRTSPTACPGRQRGGVERPRPAVPDLRCGAKVSGIYAASVLLAFAGLNITLLSYIDRLDFGLTSDPDLLDDPWEIADGLQDALAELMDAAGLGKPTPVHDPFDV